MDTRGNGACLCLKREWNDVTSMTVIITTMADIARNVDKPNSDKILSCLALVSEINSHSRNSRDI